MTREGPAGRRVVKAVLFDFHETLISADRWMAMETGSIATEILQQLGIWGAEPPAEQRRTVEGVYATLRTVSRDTGVEYPAGTIARLALEALGLERRFGEPEITRAIEALFRRYLPDVTIKDGVAEALDALARRGYRMGIVSNVTYAPFLTWTLEDHGLRSYFEGIVTSAEVGLRKPRGEVFVAALGMLGLAPREATYVGNDYLKDVMGARLAGLWAVWVPGPSAKDYRAYTAVRPNAVAGRFSLVPDLIDRMQVAREVVS